MSPQEYIRSLSIISALPPKSPSRTIREISGLQLRTLERADETVGMALPTPPIGALPEKPFAAVDTGALLSFVEGIDAQEREDILFSVQLAARGASASHDRYRDSEAWYRKYLEVLEHLGWTCEQFAFSRYQQSSGQLRMDKVALAVVAAIATQNQLAVLQESLHALENLAADDGTIRLLAFHALAQASGNFQIGAVQKSANGTLSMALGAFHFQGDDQRKHFLFFSWGALSVQFWTAAQKMTFNAAHYASLRDEVKRRLGQDADAYIADLPLA